MWNMLKYFYLMKELFLINPALLGKALFWGIFFSWLGWKFVLKRPLYQQIYGVPTNENWKFGKGMFLWIFPNKK